MTASLSASRMARTSVVGPGTQVHLGPALEVPARQRTFRAEAREHMLHGLAVAHEGLVLV